MSEKINGDLTTVKAGIICQQVNCRNAYGKGLSGSLSAKWPKIEQDYRDSFIDKSQMELFGTYRLIELEPNLYCANIYSQMDYGDSRKNGNCYTNMDALVDSLTKIAGEGKAKGLPVYIPEDIGCGLAGGNKQELEDRTQNLDIIPVIFDKDKNIPFIKNKNESKKETTEPMDEKHFVRFRNMTMTEEGKRGQITKFTDKDGNERARLIVFYENHPYQTLITNPDKQIYVSDERTARGRLKADVMLSPAWEFKSIENPSEKLTAEFLADNRAKQNSTRWEKTQQNLKVKENEKAVSDENNKNVENDTGPDEPSD